MARTDAQRIAASGRTLEEHRDIVRSLKTDPRAAEAVRLDFESGDFAGWSVRRLCERLFGGDPERDRAHRHEGLPFRDQARRPCVAGAARGIARLVQRSLRGGHLVRLFDLSAEGFRAAEGRRASCWRNGTTRRNLAIHPASRRSQSAIWTALCASRARFRKWPPRIRTSGMFSTRFRTSPTKRGSISSSGSIGRGTAIPASTPFSTGKKIFRFDGPLGYRNEIKGPYFKLGVYASGEISGPLVAYHDNYSRADSFEAVDPSVVHVPADKR